jgi:hypothetical protein
MNDAQTSYVLVRQPAFAGLGYLATGDSAGTAAAGGAAPSLSPTTERVFGAVNTGVGVLFGYASYRLWKSKHPIGAIAVGVLLAAPWLAWGLARLVTGKNPVEELRRGR